MTETKKGEQKKKKIQSNKKRWRMRNRQCAIEGVKLSKIITESGTVRKLSECERENE